MRQFTRRRFLAGSAAGTAALLAPTARVLGANNDLRVAVIGFRGKGNQHRNMVRGMKGIRLVALCDADRKIVDRQNRSDTGLRPFYQYLREGSIGPGSKPAVGLNR